MANRPALLLLAYLAALASARLAAGGFQYVLVTASLLLLGLLIASLLRLPAACQWAGALTTLLLAALAYGQYLNALALGYYDGMLYGTVGAKHEYYDISEYYYESERLAAILGSPAGREQWLAGGVAGYGTYGPYNAYNLFNACLMLLFGGDVVTLVLLKLGFSVVAFYLLYALAGRFVGPAAALGAVLAYNLYPGYLIGATNLLRDNIIAALIIILAYLGTGRHPPALRLAGIVLAAGLLGCFRNYALAILTFSTAVYIFCRSRWLTRAALLAAVAAVPLAGWLLRDRLLDILEAAFQEDGPHLWESSAPGLVRMVLRIGYFMFLGQPGKAEDFYLGSITEWLNLSGYIYLHLILVLSLMALPGLMAKGKKADRRVAVVVFGYLMPVLFLALLTFIFGWPIPRLYSMWLWVTCIIVGMFLETASRPGRLIATCGAVALVSAFYFLQYSPFAGLVRIGAVFQ